jgi:uncharacterized protein
MSLSLSALAHPSMSLLLSATLLLGTSSVQSEPYPIDANEGLTTTSDLSYESYVHSNKRFKCLYGYAAEKTGDHKAAMAIFNDCINRWHDVYSMIWLAQMYEAGISMPQDLARSTELMRMGAEDAEIGGYAALARYHYGIALNEGKGIEADPESALGWLERAEREGVPEAGQYLKRIGAQ